MDQIDQLFSRALASHRRGDVTEAERYCREILSLIPDHGEACHLLAVICHRRGDGKALREAGRLYQKALDLNPDDAIILCNYANYMKSMARYDEAERLYRKALALQPEDATGHFNLGSLYHVTNNVDNAEKEYRQALLLDANLYQAAGNLGLLLMDQGLWNEALTFFNHSLDINGSDKVTLLNKGVVLRLLGQVKDAIACYKKALLLDPNYAEAHSNLGIAYQILEKSDRALSCHRRAVSCAPDSGDAHWNYALCLLETGDFTNGWPEYEWRWQAKRFTVPKRQLPGPLWQDEPCDGKTLLVYAEQGLGDTIQFARFLFPLAEREQVRVVFEVQPTLKPLFSSWPVVETLLGKGETIPEEIDYQLPLLSLPSRLKLTATQLPLPGLPEKETRRYCYLGADPVKVADWQKRLPTGKMRVGICWRGNPHHQNDRNRSVLLARLSPILSREDCHFVSLQLGESLDQRNEFSQMEKSLTASVPTIQDFSDTAALATCLDLVITVDTSVAHLCGALGVKTWLLLPRPADWRWMHDESSTPWYPAMTLFRQRRVGDWDEVIQRVNQQLNSSVDRL